MDRAGSNTIMKKIGDDSRLQAGIESYKGFSAPTTTPTPDDLFDRFLPELSGGELNVLLYIIRRTFGVKKEADAISLSQLCSGIRTHSGKYLDRGTGLSLSAVKVAVRSLERRGLITIQRVREENGYNFVNIYSLRFQEMEVGQKMAYSRPEND